VTHVPTANMADTQFFDKGIEHIKLACEADTNEEWEPALSNYRKGLDYLMTGLKYCKNPAAKERVKEMLPSYLERAEKVQEIINNGGNVQSSKGGVAVKKKTDKDKDNEENEENEMEAQMIKPSECADGPSWKDVAGLEDAKALLYEAVILPQRLPHLYHGKRKPFKGILMYGPPGTGKSFLAQALANEAKSNFFSITAGDIVSRWMGESEQQVQKLFAAARANKPAIIFIDEVDSIASARGDGKHEASTRLLTELLTQMDGFGTKSDGVVVIAATNCPWDIDTAMKRRLEKRVLIPLPDVNSRLVMFKLNLGKEDNILTEDDFRHLAHLTEGYSGSDIKTVSKDALQSAVRKMTLTTHFKQVKLIENNGSIKIKWMPCSPGDPGANYFSPAQYMELGEDLALPPVDMGDYAEAIKTSPPSVNAADMAKFEEWTKENGMVG